MHDTHHHHEHHEHKEVTELSDREKFIKRVEHWIRHNDEHIRGYEDWKEWCEKEGLKEVAEILDEVCSSGKKQSELLRKALDILKRGHG